MSDDLVTQIKERRLHHMYPHHLDELLDEAATAFSEARVVIERLNAQVDEALRSCLAEREGRLKAETAISTLRARVREVVGPFAAWIEAVDVDPSVEFPDHASIELTQPGAEPPVRITGVDFRAARQLNEDLK
ncbi:MAG: hypothetical protein J0I08_16865 [Rhizobiales bacterium]|nr:hypothetical protein [Hyphomicrobiales bacterium]